MGEAMIFNKINSLLEDSGLHSKIENLSELREFLKDEKNIGMDTYEQIEELYALLILGPGMW